MLFKVSKVFLPIKVSEISGNFNNSLFFMILISGLINFLFSYIWYCFSNTNISELLILGILIIWLFFLNNSIIGKINVLLYNVSKPFIVVNVSFLSGIIIILLFNVFIVDIIG